MDGGAYPQKGSLSDLGKFTNSLENINPPSVPSTPRGGACSVARCECTEFNPDKWKRFQCTSCRHSDKNHAPSRSVRSPPPIPAGWADGKTDLALGLPADSHTVALKAKLHAARAKSWIVESFSSITGEDPHPDEYFDADVLSITGEYDTNTNRSTSSLHTPLCGEHTKHLPDHNTLRREKRLYLVVCTAVTLVIVLSILIATIFILAGNERVIKEAPSPGPGPPAPVSTCAPEMVGVGCAGLDLPNGKLVEVATFGECCDLCAAREECAAYTHSSRDNTCTLKSWCQYLVTDDEETSFEGVTSSMLQELPMQPQPTCAVPSLGIGYVCHGTEFGAVSSDTSELCCQICIDHEDCLIFSWSISLRLCFMMTNCPTKVEDTDYITGWTPPPDQIEAAPRYQVGRASYDLDGYVCGQQGNLADKKTVMFYPKGDGPFHVVVYGHGAWGYVDGSDDWLETIASVGLIVLAPFQGRDIESCRTDFASDLLNCLNGTREKGASLHPALANADWSRTGVLGHSKGAKYAPLAASKGRDTLNVTAMVASCDVPRTHWKNEPRVASMFTTGTLDRFNVPNSSMKDYYDGCTSTTKIYLNVMDAYHMEVQEGKRVNLLTAKFLSCEVSQVQEDCDTIYGQDDNAVCRHTDYAECEVVRTLPSRGSSVQPSMHVLFALAGGVFVGQMFSPAKYRG